MSHPVLNAASAALGVPLDYRGDLALLGGPRRCLLISRAEKSPRPDSPWLHATLDAVRESHARRETLVAGAGRIAYDAALWASAECGDRAIVALASAPDAADESQRIIPPQSLLVWPRETPKDSAVAQTLRDRLMGELSDRVFAIHVRKTGNMAALAARFAERGIEVVSFQTSRPPAPSPVISKGATVEGATSTLSDATGWTFLTHFTREPGGAWPGEDYADYVRWLCSGVSFAPRDAFAALCRILKEKRLRACGRLMPGNTPMVCFTELHPTRTVPLRRWRRGLLRWTFTQYGLAIRKNVLLDLGARPVKYVTREVLDTGATDDRRFMQIEKTEKYDWSAEAEWRVAGDIDLASVPIHEMLALVEFTHEAAYLSETFGVASAVIP